MTDPGCVYYKAADGRLIPLSQVGPEGPPGPKGDKGDPGTGGGASADPKIEHVLAALVGTPWADSVKVYDPAVTYTNNGIHLTYVAFQDPYDPGVWSLYSPNPANLPAAGENPDDAGDKWVAGPSLTPVTQGAPAGAVLGINPANGKPAWQAPAGGGTGGGTVGPAGPPGPKGDTGPAGPAGVGLPPSTTTDDGSILTVNPQGVPVWEHALVDDVAATIHRTDDLRTDVDALKNAPAPASSLDGLTDVAAPTTTPAGKVLGTTAEGVWGPVDPPASSPPEVAVGPTEPTEPSVLLWVKTGATP